MHMFQAIRWGAIITLLIISFSIGAETAGDNKQEGMIGFKDFLRGTCPEPFLRRHVVLIVRILSCRGVRAPAHLPIKTTRRRKNSSEQTPRTKSLKP